MRGTAQDSPDGIWRSLDRLPALRADARPWIRPARFHAVQIRAAALTNLLARTPLETSVYSGTPPAIITLPLPEGGFGSFKLAESPIMAPALAEAFPEIRTYVGQGIDDPHATLRLDWTPSGFHAQVLSPNGSFYIDPYTQGDTALHTSYRRGDLPHLDRSFECLFDGSTNVRTTAAKSVGTRSLFQSGPTLRTYRLAVAATGEYTDFHGGTTNLAMAAIVTAVNRVNGVYETEVGVRMILVSNNQKIVYSDKSNDPYNNKLASLLLNQNQNNLDSVIGSANYDIGHVFGTGGGGLAFLGCVCVTGDKAKGETGSDSPTGDAYWIDYVAHEMGHQFGANHTFNGTGGSCAGSNRNGPTAYEPGSASTIMGYAGICGSADDLQEHSDPFFHSVSFDEITAYITTGDGSGCAATSATSNNTPTVEAGVNYTIPRQTPFALTAVGSDPDSDPLTYCWEERDLGAAQAATAADNGSSPILRAYEPSTNATRIFPRLSNLLANTNALGEKLPSLARVMTLRVTVRDNRVGGGGVNSDECQVTVVTSAGPFAVTAPNTAGTWSGLSTCTWNVAGTTNAAVNCSRVNLLLSTNGGFSFDLPLATNVANDGVHLVALPQISTTNARIKVEATSNIFFDVSNANFTIAPGATDTDGDGIPDAWELQNFDNLTNANATSDFDSDGLPDWHEQLAGTDPKDTNSQLRATSATPEDAGSGFVIRWSSISNHSYDVERSTNLLEGFAVLATNLPATPPENIYTDAAPPATVHYRIQVDTTEP